MSELSEKSVAELERLLREKEEALRRFRFEMAGSKIKNVKEGRDLRREIARIRTALRERARATAAIAVKTV